MDTPHWRPAAGPIAASNLGRSAAIATARHRTPAMRPDLVVNWARRWQCSVDNSPAASTASAAFSERRAEHGSGAALDVDLQGCTKGAIRENATPRHVPAKILTGPDRPRTRNGTLVELAVRDLEHRRSARIGDALANPDALERFGDLAELAAE